MKLLTPDGDVFDVPVAGALTEKIAEQVEPLFAALLANGGVQEELSTRALRALVIDSGILTIEQLQDAGAVQKAIGGNMKAFETYSALQRAIRRECVGYLTLDKETRNIIRTIACVIADFRHADPKIISASQNPDFWEEQDLNGLLKDVDFFRQGVGSLL